MKYIITKKFFALFIMLMIVLPIFSESAKYQTENLNISVNYNKNITPGDPLFVRLQISNPKHKKNKLDFDRKAVLQLYLNEKQVDSVPFYSLNKHKKQNTSDFLCGIAASPWWVEGNYSLKIIFEENDESVKEFDLPLVFVNRDFNKEVIELNQKNTEIRTTKEPAKVAQTEKLTEIINTTIDSDIFSVKNFIKPIDSERKTAEYGDRRTYKYSNGKTSTTLHYGNDYGVPEGTEVHSCAEGKVVMAESRISTGNSIVIEHLPGLYSLYYHLSEIKVKEGDMVKANELIGKSGSTGLATGPHLHWEVRLNSQAVRPEFFLNDFTFENN